MTSTRFTLFAVCINWWPVLLAGLLAVEGNTGLQAQTTFRDVTARAGIRHVFKVFQGTFGGGAAVFDLNNDGYDDVYIAGGIADDQLYLNNRNGTFTNIAAKAGLKLSVRYVTQGATCADVNKDGWVDLYVTTISDGKAEIPRAKNLLFLNQGNNTFRDGTAEFGLEDYQTFSTGAAFGDINADGYPDLFVGNYFQAYKGPLNIMNDAMIVGSQQLASAQLFINVDGDHFEDAYARYGLNQKGFGFGGYFTDYDNDRDLDLIIVNDFGYKAPPNLLLENQYPKAEFKDVSKAMGMKLPINGMGIAAGDYNNDGWMDYAAANIRANPLMMNQGRGKPFVNRNMELGTGLSRATDSLGSYLPVSWGLNFADFDNDTDLDLFVPNGSLNPNVEPNPDYYFENSNGRFTEKAQRIGLSGRDIGRGSVVFDYDNDGDLDLLVVNQEPVSTGGGFASTTKLYRNEGTVGNWLKVSLTGVDADKNGLGARVEIVIGKLRMIREVEGASGHESRNSSVIHFGLGAATSADSVIVRWVGGKTQVLTKQAVNQLLHITEINNRPPSFWQRWPMARWWLGALVLSALLGGGLFFYRKKRHQIQNNALKIRY